MMDPEQTELRRIERLGYLRDMAAEMREMASDSKYMTLAYIFHVAALEGDKLLEANDRGPSLKQRNIAS